jgi:hypothetical protein
MPRPYGRDILQGLPCTFFAGATHRPYEEPTQCLLSSGSSKRRHNPGCEQLD